MKYLKIKLRKEDIQKFCYKLSKFQSEFDIYSKKRVIDGKSILGVCTLDFAECMYIHCILHNNEKIEDIKKELEEFLIYKD